MITATSRIEKRLSPCLLAISTSAAINNKEKARSMNSSPPGRLWNKGQVTKKEHQGDQQKERTTIFRDGIHSAHLSDQLSSEFESLTHLIHSRPLASSARMLPQAGN